MLMQFNFNYGCFLATKYIYHKKEKAVKVFLSCKHFYCFNENRKDFLSLGYSHNCQVSKECNERSPLLINVN